MRIDMLRKMPRRLQSCPRSWPRLRRRRRRLCFSLKMIEQCEDLIYRFKRFNVDKKLNLHFLRDPPLPERVTEEIMEAYMGEDVDADSSSGSESSSEEEETTPTAEPSVAHDTKAPAPLATTAETMHADPLTP
ncbi:unnamed protein product [Prunus brigantina]